MIFESRRETLECVVEPKVDDFRRLLIRWAKTHFRRYTWRNPNSSPYEVLVAELLLKRTTATAVSRLYPAFIKKYSGLEELTRATEAELIQDLEPIGLNIQRAQSIVKMTSHLQRLERGRIPTNLGRLLAVPGLGEYSARAVLSFGLDIPAAIVDGNIRRVLERVFSLVSRSMRASRQLQNIADALLPIRYHRQFNFGLLDVSAQFCRPVNPRCLNCPLSGVCEFAHELALKKNSTRVPSPLKIARLSCDLSLVELSSRAGVSKSTIVDVEAGRRDPRFKTIQRLAAAMGVSTEEMTC